MTVMTGTMCQSIFRHNLFSSSGLNILGGVDALSSLYREGEGGGSMSSTLKSMSRSFSDLAHTARSRELLMSWHTVVTELGAGVESPGSNSHIGLED